MSFLDVPSPNLDLCLHLSLLLFCPKLVSRSVIMLVSCLEDKTAF